MGKKTNLFKKPEDKPKLTLFWQWQDFISRIRRQTSYLFLTPMKPEVIVATIFVNLLSLALPLSLLHVYDRIIPNQSWHTFTYILIGLVGVLVSETLLKILRHHITGWQAATYESQQNYKILHNILYAPLQEINIDSPGKCLDRLNGIDKIKEYIHSHTFTIFVDFPFIILFLGLIYWIAGWLVLIPLILMLVYIFVSLNVIHYIQMGLQKRAENDDFRYSFIVDMLSGIYNVKALSYETGMIRRFERLQERSASINQYTNFVAGVNQTIGQIFSQLMVIGIVGFGSLIVLNHEITIGGLAACTLIAGRTLQPFLRIMNMWGVVQNLKLAQERLIPFLHLPIDGYQKNKKTIKKKAPLFQKTLVWSNIYFAYNKNKHLLKKASFTIKTGEFIVITGANNQGKSTLLRLLSGLEKPSRGRYLIDDTLVQNYDYDTLQENITLISQDEFLFQGTIMDNLTCLGKNNDIKAILNICEALGLNEKITKLPQGFETPIGDLSPLSLPAGLKQLIIIARGIALNKPLLLLDEIYSGFDFATDAQLINTLTKLKRTRTIIMVAHRPSYIRLADRVYHIENYQLHINNTPINPFLQGDYITYQQGVTPTVSMQPSISLIVDQNRKL